MTLKVETGYAGTYPAKRSDFKGGTAKSSTGLVTPVLQINHWITFCLVWTFTRIDLSVN
jgi:hypothetical protein